MIRPVKSVQWGKKIVKVIEIYPKLGSSNLFARDVIKSGGLSGTVLWILEQIEGVGRRGRKWDADQSSLTFSIIWRCPKDEAPQNLTLAVGLGLVQSLSEAIGLSELKVKWPNDLWIEGKKLGGILTEAMYHRGDRWIILGIGLNVNALPPKGDLSPRISMQQVTGCFWPRLGVLDVALLGVERGFDLAKNGEDLSALFRIHGNFLDRTITVFQGGKAFRALAKDVLPDGSLLIEDARGERALLPEEITVRF